MRTAADMVAAVEPDFAVSPPAASPQPSLLSGSDYTARRLCGLVAEPRTRDDVIGRFQQRLPLCRLPGRAMDGAAGFV